MRKVEPVEKVLIGITVYDAYFMALSQVEKKMLLTADCKFMERVKGFRCQKMI